MADTQSHTPGVIRSTKDYIQESVTATPDSSDNSDEAQSRSPVSTFSGDDDSSTISTSRDNPREIRNKAEKQRRDKLNQSISQLASIVPPVIASKRKMDKTGVLRLTAHYLRSHQYVFGDTIDYSDKAFSAGTSQALLGLLNGFLLTTTYKGLIVVVSQNVQESLGYTELELLGQSVFNIIHEEDRQMVREQLMPKSHMLGPNGELLIPKEPDGVHKIEEALAKDKRRFIVRFKKLTPRSQPAQYLTCHVEGSLRKSDRACGGSNRCHMVRRARARGENPCSSGNDVVFIGIVRPTTETFMTETAMEASKMEYRTRHSVDGEIIQCDQRISIVTGYMMHEVNGVNAMNFMHRDDVRFVIIALRDMYDQHRLVGESCYRLMAKNGQFMFMRTRGRLEVDPSTKAVTSFVCTNTVVDEEEGKHLIELMKKKFSFMVNNNDNFRVEEETSENDTNNTVHVEDPKRLKKVILHLVTNLPSSDNDNTTRDSPDTGSPPPMRISIIPPKKERIVGAIEKIYKVIKTIPKSSVARLLKPITPIKVVKTEDDFFNGNINTAIVGNDTVDTGFINNAAIDTDFVDNATVDTRFVDTGFVDNATVDTGFVDNATVDTGFVDNATVDTGFADTTVDTGFVDNATVNTGFVDKATVDTGFADTDFVDNATVDTAYGDNATVDTRYVVNTAVDTGFVDNATVDTGFVDNAAVNTAFGDNATVDTAFGDNATVDTRFVDNATVVTGFGDNATVHAAYFDNAMVEPVVDSSTDNFHNLYNEQDFFDFDQPFQQPDEMYKEDMSNIFTPPVDEYKNYYLTNPGSQPWFYRQNIDTYYEPSIRYHGVFTARDMIDFAEAGPSSAPVGMKRPNNFHYDTTTAKKMSLDAIKQEEKSGADSPNIEAFLNEASLNSQLDSAISSLEATIDPSFPDLLVPSEVQEILEEIERELNDEQKPSEQRVD